MGVVVGSREQAKEYAEMIRKQHAFVVDVSIAALTVVAGVAAYALAVGF